MNENLNLVEILKYCPRGTKLYSTVFGEVKFMGINENAPYPIIVKVNDENFDSFTADGKILLRSDGECTLFPSKDQRDWSKFKPKNPKFDPKTLKPKQEIDWEQRRYEIAKEMMPVLYRHGMEAQKHGQSVKRKDTADFAVAFADTLIKELKEQSE